LGARSSASQVLQGPVAQLVSAPPCHGGGRGFKSRLGRIAASPTLLIAAHGTASLAGHRTLISLVGNVRALRPSVTITLGFVDVLLPRVEDVLDAVRGSTVLVPALLSSGYHVSADIPRAVRRRRGAAISRHLGPDPLLTRALADQLAAARGSAEPRPVTLVSAGSSDPVARTELEAATADLASLLGVAVRAASLNDPTLDLSGMEVASYLLAEGTMSEAIAARASAAGAALIVGPIGTHPAVAELIVRRYDEGLGA
jgi:sirohydrochlorin ferrochelatase